VSKWEELPTRRFWPRTRYVGPLAGDSGRVIPNEPAMIGFRKETEADDGC
jgi:hypothetical protein